MRKQLAIECYAILQRSKSQALITSPSVPRLFTSASVTESRSLLKQLKGRLRDYKQLSKARLSALVVSTAAAGFVAGSQDSIDWRRLGWTSLGTMLAASSANAFNQIYEIKNDALMKRTALRPLPTGRLSRAHAIAFAVLAGGASILVLSEKTNDLTAALGASNILLYAGVYTPLKVVSIANTWVGAIVGAVPPLMGWASATGTLDAGSILLAAGLFFWQMPHFMALAWLCRADYAAGGYRMLSLIDPTGKRTAACALRNCCYLFPLGALSTWLGVTTPFFAYTSAFITAGMMLTAAKFYSSPTNQNARLLFRASLLHLPVFMVAFLLCRIPYNGEDKMSLLMKNAKLLGIQWHAETNDDTEGNGDVVAQMTEGGFDSPPPLPFLPLPPLLTRATDTKCRSAVMCECKE